jgi:hypothetical protein
MTSPTRFSASSASSTCISSSSTARDSVFVVWSARSSVSHPRPSASRANVQF